MKFKFPRVVLLASLILLFFTSCGPGGPISIKILSPVPTTPGATCPTEDWPCPSDRVTLTAEMATRMAGTPSNTPPAGVTISPMPGDLGWGAVYGKITDGVTARPIGGAMVECEHFSYTSPSPCKGITTTNAEGLYSFVPVFFHDTDRIVLLIEAPGYSPLRFEQSFFTRPEFHADLGLFRATDETMPPTPPPTFTALPNCTAYPCPDGRSTCGPCPSATPEALLMCTPPPCPGGSFACGNPKGCPGGCGTICLTPTP